jgi:K+-transporting ATPase ATPase B chain
MSGVDLKDARITDGVAPTHTIRKGASDAVATYVAEHGGTTSDELKTIVDGIASVGSTPLVVAETEAGSDGAQEQARVLGVIELKDIVKGGMRTRFDELRKMGIRTIMITGDNPLTAAAIAKESGVDDFLAQATPETKMKLIKEQQSGGRMVAMTGDGTNDAPALAQADVGVAMNTGTQAAKEAANMVDLDSNPTKLIEVVEVGKQLLITRGSLTTFSIANDVAKYFAIIPAAFAVTYPQLKRAQYYAVGHAAQRGTLSGNLQRTDHRGADPAGVARRKVSPNRGRLSLAPQPVDLRRRWHNHPVRRY